MKKFIFIIVAVFVALIPVESWACSCMYTTPATAYNQAPLIFVGKMVSSTEKHERPAQGGKSEVVESGQVVFNVTEVFKGSPAKTVTLRVDSMAGTSCGTYGLTRGLDYVVYAYALREDPNRFYTGVCTRTASADNDRVKKEDLFFLRNLPPAGSGGTIKGRIWLDTKSRLGGGAAPMPGISFTVTGSSTANVYRVVTDKKGEFEINGVPAGKYEIAPKVPKNYFVEDLTQEVIVADLGTATTGIEVYYDGHIRGRLFDREGHPYNDASLQLEGGNKEIYGSSTGKNGVFEVDGIPPGSYLLYLELHDDDYTKNRKYYFPGTFKREQAKAIKVGLGQTVNGLRFVLPPQFRLRTLSGRVFWADGKPARDVEVNLLCPRGLTNGRGTVEFGPTTATSDADGNFRLEGFIGTEYWLEARARATTARGDHHSPSNKIVLSADIRHLRVVLSEKGFYGTGC